MHQQSQLLRRLHPNPTLTPSISGSMVCVLRDYKHPSGKKRGQVSALRPGALNRRASSTPTKGSHSNAPICTHNREEREHSPALGRARGGRVKGPEIEVERDYEEGSDQDEERREFHRESWERRLTLRLSGAAPPRPIACVCYAVRLRR